MKQRRGYQTTEFWLTVVAVVVGLLLQSGVFAETSAVAKALIFIAQTLAVMGYSYSRGIVKSK